MDPKALFDAIRRIKGSALTDADVALVNSVIDAKPVPPVGAYVDPLLLAQLKIDEGLRLRAYRDTVGVWTIGYGRAYVPPGTVWTREQAEAALVEDIISHNATVHRALPWLRNLDPVRRRVIENMHFNMGWDNPKTPKFEGLSGFKNTLARVQAGDFDGAAAGMAASLWAKQVGERADRLIRRMRTGVE